MWVMGNDNHKGATIMATETTLTLEDVRQAFNRGDFDYQDCRNIKSWAGKRERWLAKQNVRGMKVGDVMQITENGVTFKVELEKINQTKCDVIVLEDSGRWSKGAFITAPMALLERC